MATNQKPAVQVAKPAATAAVALVVMDALLYAAIRWGKPQICTVVRCSAIKCTGISLSDFELRKWHC